MSIGTTLLLVGVGAAIWLSVPGGKGWLRWLVPAMCLLVVVGAALFTIRGYRLEGRTVRVRRLFWWTQISLEGLREAKVDPEAMRKALRILGNGGLFSFSGWYWSKSMGRFKAYVTDPRWTVVLSFRDHRIVMSPDRPEVFVEILNRSSPRSGR